MTLDEALGKVSAELDSREAHALAETASVLRHHGATDEELETEMSILRSDLAAQRSSVLEDVRAFWETGARVQ